MADRWSVHPWVYVEKSLCQFFVHPYFFRCCSSSLCSSCRWPKEVCSLHNRIFFFFFFHTCECLDPVFALQQEGRKSGEGVLFHPHSSPRYAAWWGKWNPSLILDGCTHRHGSEEYSVAAVLKGVLKYRATSSLHHRSEVIGRELSVEVHRHGKKMSTSFTVVKSCISLFPMICSCAVSFSGNYWTPLMAMTLN